MPIPVNFKGLAVIEYPDDWTEERIREDVRQNEREITAKVTAALKDQAIAETAEDPEAAAQGFFENTGKALANLGESAVQTFSGLPSGA